MKAVRRVSAVLIGFVFFLAGILKLMDPVGAGLVVDEYFKFLHLRFLSFSSGAVAFVLALLETVTGAALITGVWRRITGIVTGVILAAFTVLTLFLWIFNPAMDCGCFGEALHLTHFQSFIKNVVLCLLWLLAFLPLSAQETPRKTKYAAFGIAALSVLAFAIFSLKSIPLLDFTPYSPGTELLSAALPEEGAPALSFSDSEGVYCDSLALAPKVAAISVYNPRKLSEASWNRISSAVKAAEETGFAPLLLLASTPSSFSQEPCAAELEGYAYFADRRDLLTLNRSNGGVTLISDGQIVAKWPASAARDFSRCIIDDASDATEMMMAKESSRRMKMQGFLLYVFAVMLLL